MTIVASILYHFFQKSIPEGVDPLFSLLVTYSVALVATVALVPVFSEREEYFIAISQVTWPSYGLGGAIVLLELGFLLAPGTRISILLCMVS